jgi:hypothetical protein
MEAVKSKQNKQYFVIPKNPKKSQNNPEKIPSQPIPAQKPQFLDSSRPDPDRSQNVHPAGLWEILLRFYVLLCSMGVHICSLKCNHLMGMLKFLFSFTNG